MMEYYDCLNAQYCLRVAESKLRRQREKEGQKLKMTVKRKLAKDGTLILIWCIVSCIPICVVN